MRALSCAAALAATLFGASVTHAQEAQTISPGMTEEEVRGSFGSPDGTSSAGIFTYYFYDNGWEPEAGFPDLVIFQGGQVTDAILRSPSREYMGISSSPKGIAPKASLGVDPLDMPGQIEGLQVRPVPPAGIPQDLPVPPPVEPEPPQDDLTPPPAEQEPPAEDEGPPADNNDPPPADNNDPPPPADNNDPPPPSGG